MRVHVERAHTAPPSGEKLYTCSQCTCIFKKVASLNAHITRCHSEGKKNDVIADVMQRLKQLEQHTLPMNNVDVGDQSLTESDLTDGVENNDKQNTTTIHSNINGIIQKYVVKYKKVDSVRWYICSFCGKDFKKPSDLIRHIRTHTKEKPFKVNKVYKKGTNYLIIYLITVSSMRYAFHLKFYAEYSYEDS